MHAALHTALETNGFVVSTGLLAAEEVEVLRACLDQFQGGQAPTSAQVLYTHALPAEPRPLFERLMRQWLNPHRRAHPGNTAKLLACVERRLGTLGFDIVPFQDALLVKTADHAPFPWHQDEPYWPFDAPSGLIAWCALDPVGRDNGGVELASGSHLLGRGPAIDLHTGEPQAGHAGPFPDRNNFTCECPSLRPGERGAVSTPDVAPIRSQRGRGTAPRMEQLVASARHALAPRVRATPSAGPGRPERRCFMSLTWLLGPPGVGKTTFALCQHEIPQTVELNAMLEPLVHDLPLRKGVLSANGCLVQAVRHVELHPDHANQPALLVVAGLVPEDVLFPLGPSEEVLLLLPDRARWERQLRARPVGTGPSAQYDDYAYAALWYSRFEDWIARGLPVRRIAVSFDEGLIGRVAAR